MSILNLALADFLYCSVNLPSYALQYLLLHRWPFGPSTCFGLAFFMHWCSYSEWMALGYIGLSRCIVIRDPEFGRKFLSGRSGVAVVAAIWLYTFCLVLPTVFYTVSQSDVIGRIVLLA